MIRTSAGEPLARRIREIYMEVVGLLERHRPFAMAVEDVFQGKNVRSALTLGHARGAILLAAALRDVPIAEYAPREIKKAVVGTGQATKDQVGFMVKQQLRLKEAPSPADAADGVAAALCHCLAGSFPAMISRLKGPARRARRRTGSRSRRAGGVVYEVEVPLTVLQRLPAPGSAVELRTVQVVTDSSVALYGFIDDVSVRSSSACSRPRAWAASWRWP